MKRILPRAMAAVIGFTLGIGPLALSTKPPTIPPAPTTSAECVPSFDESFVIRHLRENDNPDLFTAFEELPLYLMPDCVDEAYSLTWIPSFHAPVVVRVWRSGDNAFMVAKELGTRGWSKFGTVQAVHSRPLTNFEWRQLTDLLKRNSYWELASTVDEVLPNDGAIWIIDGLRSKQFHWVRRDVPDREYAEICKHLIRLSGLETAHDLYLP